MHKDWVFHFDWQPLLDDKYDNIYQYPHYLDDTMQTLNIMTELTAF